MKHKENPRIKARKKRHYRARKYVIGTSERPRLCVFRSARHMYAQIIDDQKACTLVSCSTLTKDFQEEMKNGGNIEAAKKVGELIALKAKAKGIEKVVFDRGGFLYHGRVKALAESARAQGLRF